MNSCPMGALIEPGKIDLENCSLCGECVKACYTGALELIGSIYTVEDVLREVEKDRLLYETSGGGVTLSGGEPSMQPEFAAQLLEALKERGIHTALDTCGHAHWENLERLLAHMDLVLYDLKHMDPETHCEYTGQTNELVISNLKRITASGDQTLNVRIPLIPGYNDSEEHLKRMGHFLTCLNCVDTVELLPYHRLGVQKYESLGRDYILGHVLPQNEERLLEIQSLFSGFGLKVILEGV